MLGPTDREVDVELAAEGELQGEAEVVGGGGVGIGGEEGDVLLHVVVEAQGHQLREGIFGREGEFEGVATTRRSGGHAGNVPTQGRLLAIADVQTEVEVVVEFSTSRRRGGGGRGGRISVSVVVLIGSVFVFHLAVVSPTKEVEVLHLISTTYHPVFRYGLVDLH